MFYKVLKTACSFTYNQALVIGGIGIVIKIFEESRYALNAIDVLGVIGFLMVIFAVTCMALSTGYKMHEWERLRNES
jgi:hypothetical protein